MEHGIGLQTSIWNNNIKSMILLVAFPGIILFMVWIVALSYYALMAADNPLDMQTIHWGPAISKSNGWIQEFGPMVLAAVVGWFAIAWMFHQSIINKDTKARSLERSEQPEVYNLLENLCISRGLTMPKLFIIDSPALNAYASGISEKSYAITLTQGLINTLEKDELEAVIAHELAHIINRDVRLLIISVIFVGIISVLSEMMVRVAFGRRHGSSNSSGGAAVPLIVIVIIIASLGYLLSIFTRFALSRRREYMADAGAVQLTKNSDALIRALEKISGNSHLENVDDDVHQMMFDNQTSFLGLFATHPPIESRIEVLRNY